MSRTLPTRIAETPDRLLAADGLIARDSDEETKKPREAQPLGDNWQP